MENRLYNSNDRAVINEIGDVRQVTNFYPFGGVFCTTAYNRGDDLQPYKYNGKELDRTHGLDWYDYGARNYDAFLPGFTTIDPHCEKYYNVSPYAYCGNNPILLVDPNGMDWLLVTGDKVIWYGGDLGDTKDEIMAFNATSGYKNEDKNEDYQSAEYQTLKNIGPTPEGLYHINLKPDPSRHAGRYQNADGTFNYKKSPDGGIEQLNYCEVDEQGEMRHFSSPDWGNQRAALTPDKVTGATNSQRDNSSYYFHDSQKGYTHGCVEVESSLFNMLAIYRAGGNTSISVQVKYPNSKHKTNGGTKR